MPDKGVTDAPKASVFSRINRFLLPISTVIGTVKTIVSDLYTIHEKGPIAWQLARQITAYVGVLTIFTYALSLFVVALFQSFWKRYFGPNGILVGIGVVVLLEIGFSLFGDLNYAALNDAWVIQAIGAAVIVGSVLVLLPRRTAPRA